MTAEQLVGRADALAVLSAAIAGPTDRSHTVLVVGEPGIGKTACLRAAETLARGAGRLVLDTAGSEAETTLAFAGVQRLLRPLLAFVPDLPDVQRHALLVALGLAEGNPGDDFLVSLATLGLLRAACDHDAPVLLIDDLHQLDEQSRRVLAFVARRLDRLPVAVVATASSGHRAPELSGPRDPVGADLADGFRELRLERLDEAGAHRLLAHRARRLDRSRRRWVVSHAVGNPLALIELAATAAHIDVDRMDPVSPVWSLTPALERAFADGLRDLPRVARDAVLVAAVASEANLQEILAATSVLNGHDVGVAALETAQARGLLGVEQARVTFSHPLVKTAVVQGESVSRRQAAHRALGAVITVNAYRRAWHRALGAAARDDAIALELEATTAVRLSHGGSAAVIPALERASQLSQTPADRGRRLLNAARHAARLGQPDVVSRLMGLVVTSELSEFDRIRAELLREDLDGALLGDADRVVTLCAAARRAADAGELEFATELAEAAARRRCGTPVDASVSAELGELARALTRRTDAAPAVTVLALANPVEHGRATLGLLAGIDASTVADGDALTAYGVAARAVGHYGLAAQLFDRAEVILRARGLLGPLARNLSVAADLRLDLGEWDRAAAALAAFATLSAASMSPSHRVSALSTEAKLAALRGDPSTALDIVAESEHSPAVRSGSRQLARLQIVRGIAHLSAGQHGDAYAALARLFDPADPTHHRREQLDAVGFFAEAAAHAGRRRPAGSIVEAMTVVIERCGSPFLASQVSYARAVLAPDDTAEPLFLAALASGTLGSPWLRARVELAYGRWLRRQLRVTHSREPLRAALITFQRLGAARWAREALDELEASGARDGGERQEVVGTANPLSAQELKIAHLAAGGLSNREIGHELYLSPRTVSSHLYRIFPKLGIATRGQLALRLDELYASTGVSER